MNKMHLEKRLLCLMNKLRFPFLYLISFGKVKAIGSQYSCMKTKFKTYEGMIYMGEGCHIENGTLIQASNGTIELEGSIYINRNCTVVAHNNIHIGKGTTIGPNVCIYDHDHNYRKTGSYLLSAPVVIGKNVWIGAGCIILRGSVIGDNCVVGAGSVIKGEYPMNTLLISKREIEIKDIPKEIKQ